MFLYAVPLDAEKELVDPERVRAMGLDVPLRDRMTTADWKGAGRLAWNVLRAASPLDQACVLVAAPSPNAQGEPLYRPLTQTWRKIRTAAGTYAIGWETGRPPAPEDLERDKLLPGPDVELADGRVWRVPVARHDIVLTDLPRKLGWETSASGEGRVTQTVVPEWDWLWQLSGEVWDWWFGEALAGPSEQYHWSALALSANYRVGPVECDVLGLFTTETVREVARGLLDADRFLEFIQTAEGKQFLEELGVTAKKNDAPPGEAPAAETETGADTVPSSE